MNSPERFRRALAGEPVDRLPVIEWATWWDQTLDAWHAAGDKIKILYGVEGYFINNVDDRIAVHGDGDFSFDEEYVAFDLETTGLSSLHDTIIEIGAAIMKGKEVLSTFQMFVDPHRPLQPKIIDLTGITDQMLAGQPDISEAIPQLSLIHI